MLRIQYLSNGYCYVWVTASCMVTSLHANVSLLPSWQQFSFDMQMFWLEEFKSFSAALKLLLYRGRICGICPLLVVFRCSRKVSSVDAVAGSTNKYERPLSNRVSFPPEWRNQERVWVCSDSSGLKSSGWHWAAQAVFVIGFAGTVELGVVCIITADLCSFF